MSEAAKVVRKKFKAKLESRGPGGGWTSLTVPFKVEEVFGTRARVAVKSTINGVPFRTSIMPESDGTHSMMVNKTMQQAANVKPGDTVTVLMELDSKPRVVSIPADLKKAFVNTKSAAAAFKELSYSRQKEFVDWVDSAKKEETRRRRVEQTISMLWERKRLKT
jgi:hypothetical protein